MIYIDIHRQRLSKKWANIYRFVLSPWGNYRELTVPIFLRIFIKKQHISYGPTYFLKNIA